MEKRFSNISLSEVRRPGRGSRFIWTASLIGIALLLLALALLQYRWNAQIRKAAEVQIGANLESVMMKWHLDLYGELSTICVALQVGPDSGAHDRWDDYLQRYQKWRRAGSTSGENIYSNPDVVSDIYIWETTQGENARLLRLNANDNNIQAVDKPTELIGLLDHLQKASTNLAVALRAWDLEVSRQVQSRIEPEPTAASRVRSNAITGWQFDESIPAIVHPIVRNGTPVASESAPVDWFLIVLNRATIERRIFPELATRYFGRGQEFEYKVAVVSVGTASRTLYSSDPDFGINEVTNSDSVMNIFGPPPESTENSFWQGVKNKESLRGEEWHSFSGPVWFPVIQSSKAASWMLFLKHRTVPLETSINRVWRGNLILGGVILLLLTVSMFLVIAATQRERALARMQMDFVASISHELRTPLAAMLSAGQNISDGFAPDLRRYGSIIINQSRQLIDLVDQILLFAAMKDGKKEYAIEPVELEEVLRALQKTTLPILEQQGFAIEIQSLKETPSVLGDFQGILRCVQNLLENAAKYSVNSRWIGISVNTTDVANVGPQVTISVADHGIGIEPDELEHICDPFYRGTRALAAQIRGSGLGLSVVRHIMKAIGGRLSVASDKGKGSTFSLHLKVASRREENSNATEVTTAL